MILLLILYLCLTLVLTGVIMRFMDTMLTTSLSWQTIRRDLELQFFRLPGERCTDAYRMLRNIDVMVKNLALKEIEVRAGRAHTRYLEEPVKQINEVIEMLEEFLIIEVLSR